MNSNHLLKLLPLTILMNPCILLALAFHVAPLRIRDVKANLENATSLSLSIPERRARLDIFLQYSGVFDKSLGHITAITYKTDTGDATAIRRIPRRLSYAH